jgi:hypothetical protein
LYKESWNFEHVLKIQDKNLKHPVDYQNTQPLQWLYFYLGRSDLAGRSLCHVQIKADPLLQGCVGDPWMTVDP